MIELTVLQAVRLKGRPSLDEVAATLGREPSTIGPTVAALTESGHLLSGKSLRLSPEGRVRLNALLSEEREGTDPAAIADAYREFRSVNAEFKALVADWQIKDGSPNVHDDAEYDAGVLARLDQLHLRTTPILSAVVAQLPRLSQYGEKLNQALIRVDAGETAWLTRPIVDSYHTVWFELHEELIIAAGLTREEEAAAGHA